MSAILDPTNGLAMCETCGQVYGLVAWAEGCCAEPPDPPRTRTVVAGALILLALIYLFAYLPFAT